MKDFLKYIGLTFLYLLLGRLCVNLAAPPGFSSPIWLPIGVCVASLFILDLYIVLFSTLSGSFLLSLYAYSPIQKSIWSSITLSCLIAIGSGLCVLTAYAFTKKFKENIHAKKEENLIPIVIAMGPLSAIISALISSSVLYYFELIDTRYFITNSIHWWVGDSTGITLLLPYSYMLVKHQGKLRNKHFISLGTILVCVLMSLVFTFTYTNKVEVDYLKESYAKDADRLIREIDDSNKLNLELFSALSSFYEGSDFVEEQEFNSFLNTMITNHPSIEQIVWIPAKDSKKYKAFYSYSTGPAPMEPLLIQDKVFKKNTAYEKPSLGPYTQNRQIFIFPVTQKSKTLGYIVGLVSLEKLITSAAQYHDIGTFEVQLIDTDTRIGKHWKNGTLTVAEKTSPDSIVNTSQKIRILNHDWKVDITTTRAQLFKNIPNSTAILLIFGLIFAIFSSLLQILVYSRD